MKNINKKLSICAAFSGGPLFSASSRPSTLEYLEDIDQRRPTIPIRISRVLVMLRAIISPLFPRGYSLKGYTPDYFIVLKWERHRANVKIQDYRDIASIVVYFN